jgi:hypothetical protein
MKKPMIRPKGLEDRLHCFGCFDHHDTICMKWCQLNIRCAITQDRYQQIDIIEDLVDLAAEPWELQ